MEGSSTEYRLPAEGDHPLALAVSSSLACGFLTFLIAISDGKGLDLPLREAGAVGGAATLATFVVVGLWLRTRPRSRALRLGPEDLAFVQDGTQRWAIPWGTVISAGIVHSASPAKRYPGPSYLRLELAEGPGPQDPSLHAYDGAWWFPLSGVDTAPRLHRDLVRRVPGRTRPVETGARLPTSLATYGRSRRA